MFTFANSDLSNAGHGWAIVTGIFVLGYFLDSTENCTIDFKNTIVKAWHCFFTNAGATNAKSYR